MDHWSSPNGCHPDCPACAAERENDLISQWAGEEYTNGTVLVEVEGKVDRTEGGGAWVSAWVYVSPDQVKEALSAKD